MPRPSILLCEGASDEAFFDALIKIHAIDDVEVLHRDPEKFSPGVGGFEKRLEAVTVEQGVERRNAIVLVADNDGTPENIYSCLRGVVEKVGDFNLPQRCWAPSSRGKLPPIHFLCLPKNAELGCAETLWLQAAVETYPSYVPAVNTFVQSVGATVENGWHIQNIEKLRLRVLISAVHRRKPTIRMTEVWIDQAKEPGNIIPLNHQAFNPLVTYLRKLAE